jgi:aryl-alcohol dehydrogenase-like predicted oxidoreductase
METRRLGNSDLRITPVGLGTWAMGGPGYEFGWGPQEDQASIEATHRALELGVNWIDTAAVYGLGHAEEIVARALKTWPGKRPYVFTRCGLRWDERGKVHLALKADSIRRECEESLRRLQVEAIDLYQLHGPVQTEAEIVEGWIAMASLQRQGKVRWIGVSNFDVEQMKRAEAITPITSLQPPYSLIRREVERRSSPTVGAAASASSPIHRWPQASCPAR